MSKLKLDAQQVDRERASFLNLFDIENSESDLCEINNIQMGNSNDKCRKSDILIAKDIPLFRARYPDVYHIARSVRKTICKINSFSKTYNRSRTTYYN